MNQNEVKVPFWLIVVIVLILFIALTIYIVSLGKLDIGQEGSFPNEFKEERAKAIERHKKLKELIGNQIALKAKLERKFNLIYLSVRILFVAAWIGFLILGYFFEYISNLEDTLNYSEATLLVTFAINFLCFGSLTNLQSTLLLIKTRLENWIYGKHITIQEEIDKNQLSLFDLERNMINTPSEVSQNLLPKKY